MSERSNFGRYSSPDALQGAADANHRPLTEGDYVTLAPRNGAVHDTHITSVLGHVRKLDPRRNSATLRLIWTAQDGRRSGKDLQLSLPELAQYRRIDNLEAPKGLADALAQVRQRMNGVTTRSSDDDMLEVQRRIAKENGYPMD